MKLAIKGVAHKYRNQYLVTIDFMHGDADANSDIKIFFKNEKKATQFIEKLVKLERGTSPEDRDDEALKVIGDWPMDSTTDFSYWASYEGYKVTYFNDDGLEFNVKVVE